MPDRNGHLDFEQYHLDNGLHVVLLEDHLVPVAGVCVCYKVGSRYEQPGKTGFAHLFEHVMFEGSRNVAKTEHFGLITAAGGTLNGGTGQDLTIYHEQMPTHQLELALYLEADRMGTLLDAVTQEALDNQRDVVKNERRSGLDNAPYGRNEEAILQAVYPVGHPYHHSIIGSMDDLDRASLEDVHEFFRTYYAPNNAVLVVAGDFDAGRTREWVEGYFGDIPRRPNIPISPDGGLPPLIGTEVRQTIPDRVALSRLYFAYRAPVDTGSDRELYALEMATRVLTRGRNSRLHQSLVLDSELAQDVAMHVEPLVGGPSKVQASTTARPQTAVDDLEAAFLDGVDSLIAQPPSDEEMERARSMLAREHADQLTEQSGIANAVAWLTGCWGDPEQVNRELPHRLDIGADEIAQAARRYLRPDNRVVLTFTPAERVAG